MGKDAEFRTESTPVCESIHVSPLCETVVVKGNIGSMAKVKSFLYTAARNASLNYLKALRVRSQSQDELVRASESSADQDHFMAKMIKAQLLKYVYDEMEKLPPKLRAIFKLIYVDASPSNDMVTGKPAWKWHPAARTATCTTTQLCLCLRKIF